MSAKKSVELFYDVISPYAWLGFEGICRYQQKWNINLHLRPFLLGAVFAATENTPPGMNPMKGRNAGRDLHRMRTYMQVPLTLPSDFMGTIIQKGSLNAQRLLTAATINKPEKVEDLSRALWLRIWSQDKDITETANLLEACKAAGIAESDSQSLLGQIKDQVVKDTLKTNTNDALENGAFGAPTFVVEGSAGKKHMVFGSDRFPIIAQILGEKYDGPLNELAKTDV